MSKIPVYFMPGLAASTLIFERIALPEDVFDVFFMEWEIPIEKESLSDYALRLTKKVKHKNPVLIGVSFGGILVQEMANHILVRKLIIISSVKSNLEFSTTLKIAKITKAYKLIPMNLILNLENLIKFSFGEKLTKRLQLYEKYLSVRDIRYLEWAVEQVVLWDRTVVNPNVIHIHGDEDDIFPIKNIHNCITVKGATHILIITKYNWLNDNLPKLILES